jgi:tetratricopeptide (TPR) repeat protein
LSLGEFISVILARLNPTPFVLGWIETRPWRLLLAGLPVLMAIAGAVALRASMNEASVEVMLRHYLSGAGKAFKDGDLKGADLRYRRAASIAPDDPRPKFGLALMAEKEGGLKKATTMMESLAAGRDDIAHQANRWLIAKTPRSELDIEGRQLLLDRLERASASEPSNLDYRLSLAEIYSRAGFREHAVKHLRVVAEAKPVYRLSVLQLLSTSGDQEAIRKEAAEAERYFREQLEKEPGDLDSRLLCSSALVFQKRYKEAIELIEAGSSLNDPVVIRKAIAAVTVAWARERHVEKGDPRQVLALTSSALRADPSNTAALTLLTDLTRDAATGEEAIGLLKEQLAAGESPWLIHMILGTRALELGNTKEGAEHLEQAVKLNPGAAVAMNNLAWTLATEEPSDLSRAETLVTQAAQLAPANPQIRETRGQIYLKQERWKEALTDLEAVLPIYSREAQLARQLPHLHESLAKAYENLGNADMAQRHRELALTKKPPTKTP